MNYYLLLGVSHDADAETIRSAFRALARRYHPDAGEGSSADRFREILTAYETLNDPTRRGHYDRVLENRRARMPSFTDPLGAHGAPESMLRPSPGVVYTNRVYERLGPTHFDDFIDELFRSWDEFLFGVPRRRDRVHNHRLRLSRRRP
jgi:molecular chaperone DnaJ